MSISERIEICARDLGELARQKGVVCATAESCTGGMVAVAITEIPGSSQWFDRGFVTYTDAAKESLLDVETSTITGFGAVSEATVMEMATGAIRNSLADYSVAVSGIAGPEGGTPKKPVGTVCFAWSRKCDSALFAKTKLFDGDRKTVRLQACEYALLGLCAFLNENLKDFTGS